MLSHILSQVGAPAMTGGALIGVATSLHLLASGRITGFSGIIANTLHGVGSSLRKEGKQRTPARAEAVWQPAFLSSLLLTGVAIKSYLPQYVPLGHGWASIVAPATAHTLPSLTAAAAAVAIASGLLVGFGTRRGSGCTSGHGVCGLPRFSRRSLTAVALWFVSAPVAAIAVSKFYSSFAVVPATASGASQLQLLPVLPSVTVPHAVPAVVMAAGALGLYSLLAYRHNRAIESQAGGAPTETAATLLAAVATGSIFASGLLLSGMGNPDYILGFLDPVTHSWNPAMAFVFAGALGVNVPTFRLILKRRRPLLLPKFSLPTKTDVDRDLVTGALLFGAGWGLGGMCPGPGLLVLMSGHPLAWLWFGSMLTGMQLFALTSKSH